MSVVKTNQTLKKMIFGKQRKFYHVLIEVDYVEKYTSVFYLNERDQELLNKHGVSDILQSIKNNKRNTNEVYARKIGNNYELADGSRRRVACILGKAALTLWVCDELTDIEMDCLSESGNKYKPPSLYERGVIYERWFETGRYTSESEIERETGLTRRTVARCRNTAKLPKWLIKAYRTPNDIGPQAADRLHRIITKKLIDEKILKERAKNCVNSWDKEFYSAKSVTKILTAPIINTKNININKKKNLWLIKNKVKVTSIKNGIRYYLPELKTNQQEKLDNYLKTLFQE